MKWSVKRLLCLKNITLIIAAIIILLYLILGLIESAMKLLPVIVLVPILFWIFIAFKYERQASVMAYMIAGITILWFVIDFAFLRTQRVYWHIPMFILIAPLPAIAAGYILQFYANKRHKK
jgi:hypothetical protein